LTAGDWRDWTLARLQAELAQGEAELALYRQETSQRIDTALGPVRKLSNRLLIELDMGLQPSFHTIYCGGDRRRPITALRAATAVAIPDHHASLVRPALRDPAAGWDPWRPSFCVPLPAAEHAPRVPPRPIPAALARSCSVQSRSPSRPPQSLHNPRRTPRPPRPDDGPVRQERAPPPKTSRGWVRYSIETASVFMAISSPSPTNPETSEGPDPTSRSRPRRWRAGARGPELLRGAEFVPQERSDMGAVRTCPQGACKSVRRLPSRGVTVSGQSRCQSAHRLSPRIRRGGTSQGARDDRFPTSTRKPLLPAAATSTVSLRRGSVTSTISLTTGRGV
jgi:hypothetical protein